MIKDKGVYTTKCPECTRSIVMHVLADGSISQNKCTHCETEFAGLENGKGHNTFDIVPAVKKFSIFGNKKADPVRSREGSQRASASNGAEEKNETDEKDHPVRLKITKVEKDKNKKESFKVWRK